MSSTALLRVRQQGLTTTQAVPPCRGQAHAWGHQAQRDQQYKHMLAGAEQVQGPTPTPNP